MLSDLIAVCGFDCSKCPAYKATHSNDKAEMERVAEKWSKAAGKAVMPEEIMCDGCRYPGGRLVAYCASCNIRTCAREKRHITCAHCPECPCDKIIQRKTQEMLEDLKKTL
jgi:Protein of unknown function (DUF3795)